MPGVPPDPFRQLKDKFRNVFRRNKRNNRDLENPDQPADPDAVASGAVPVPAASNPAAPAPVARSQIATAANPTQTGNVATSAHNESAIATDSETETEIPPGKKKPAPPAPARVRDSAPSDQPPTLDPPLTGN